jgi:hypothetical protein
MLAAFVETKGLAVLSYAARAVPVEGGYLAPHRDWPPVKERLLEGARPAAPPPPRRLPSKPGRVGARHPAQRARRAGP